MISHILALETAQLFLIILDGEKFPEFLKWLDCEKKLSIDKFEY